MVCLCVDQKTAVRVSLVLPHVGSGDQTQVVSIGSSAFAC